ncbi:hypothetical protein [Pseudomonas zeae]|uniref:hypothetical protein n=1 Tax=Pseudomonas zeae TaxID=2745510 RepID=UPI0039E17151
MNTRPYNATHELLQACEVLEEFNRAARKNVQQGRPALNDAKQKAMLMQALELMSVQIFEACAVMMEPHCPQPAKPIKTALRLV